MIERDLAMCYHGLLGLALKETPDVALALEAAGLAYCDLLLGGAAVDCSLERLPLKLGAATETAPSTALPPGAAFGYVHLKDGSVGWAGENPPGNRGDWSPIQEGPKGGHFWRRVGDKVQPQVAEQGQKRQTAPQSGRQQSQKNVQGGTAAVAPMPAPAQPVSNLMRSAIAQNQSLGTLQKARYQAAVDNVLRAIPEHALKRVAANTKKVSLYGSTAELTQDLFNKHPNDPTIAKMKAKGKLAAGSFSGNTGHWRADGDVTNKDEFGGMMPARSNVHETYAHELTHAIDGENHDYSNSQEWKQAWDREMASGNFSDYARSSPAEGFAEFGRILYAGVATEEELTSFFPQTTAFFRKYGLMGQPASPQQAPVGKKTSQTVSLMESLPNVSLGSGAEEGMKYAATVFGSGTTPSAVAAAAGAKDGAILDFISARDGHVSVFVRDPHGAYRMARNFIRQRDGSLVCENVEIKVRDKGNGLGSEIFSSQVQSLRQSGVKKITCEAARGEGLNGYYTWAVLGYDGAIPWAAREKRDNQAHKLPPEYRQARTVQDILKAPGGLEWWKQNGDSFEAEFDLDPESESSKILDAYMQARKAQNRG